MKDDYRNRAARAVTPNPLALPGEGRPSPSTGRVSVLERMIAETRRRMGTDFIFGHPEILSLTPEIMVARSKPLVAQNRERISAIYFLVRDDQLVYVGQSKNLFARIRQHIWARRCDRFSYIEVPPNRLNLVEDYFIRRFAPPLNQDVWERQGHAGELAAEDITYGYNPYTGTVMPP